MRTRLVCLVLVFGAIVLTALSLSAQDFGVKHARHQKIWEYLNAISGEQRGKLKTARKQALQNPEVRSAYERRNKAEEEYRRLLDREILRIDPSVKPTLDGIDKLKKHEDL